MMNFAKVVHVITKLSQSFIRQRVPQHVDVSVPVSSHPLPLHKISKKKKMTKIITSRIISYDNTFSTNSRCIVFLSSPNFDALINIL